MTFLQSELSHVFSNYLLGKRYIHTDCIYVTLLQSEISYIKSEEKLSHIVSQKVKCSSLGPILNWLSSVSRQLVLFSFHQHDKLFLFQIYQYKRIQPIHKTLPKALWTQALTALTSNSGLVDLVQYAR